MRLFHHWIPARKVGLFVVEGTAIAAACMGGAALVSRALAPVGTLPRPVPAWWVGALVACGVGLFQYALYLVDLYDLRVATGDRATGVRVLRAAGLAAAALGAVALVAGGRFPEGAVLGAAMGAVLGALVVRSALGTVVGHPCRVAILGDGPRAVALSQWIAMDGEDGMQLLQLPAGTSLPAWVRAEQVDVVVDASEDGASAPGAAALLECRLAGASVLNVEAFVERVLRRLPVGILRAESLAFAEELRLSRMRAGFKRAFDLAAAGILCSLAWPLGLLVAVAVRLDSPGPVFYRQERVGQGGVPFLLWKFRSMRVDAERHGAAWARKDDDRVTRVGRLIRKARMDELPQLLNVLRGEMSLVGPRPERPVFVEDLKAKIPFYGLREVVKPGLTGWAQIRYPYGASVEDARNKLEYDLYYVKNGSLFLDAACLFHTVRHVLVGRGAR